VRKWPKVKEWPQVSDVILRIGEQIDATPTVVVTSTHPLESLEWREFEPPTKLIGPCIEDQIKDLHSKEMSSRAVLTYRSAAGCRIEAAIYEITS
jgi:hypothetical protein